MKVRSFQVLALAVLCVAQSAYAAVGGQDVGNGGDAIVCAKSAANFLDGTYALDYVLTLATADRDDDVVLAKDLSTSLDRLSKVISAKVPELSPSFEEFRSTLFNENDFTKVRIWEAAPFGLVDLDDAKIAAAVPSNCQNIATGKTELIQAAIRQHESYTGTYGHIVYKFMPSAVKDMGKTAPTQLSYLLVHEWLWDLSSNVDRNRRINRFLHSPRIEAMTADEVKRNLKGMGLAIPTLQAEVFDDNVCTGSLLTLKDIETRFPKDNVFFKMGVADVQTRQRNLQCPKTRLDCSKSWTKGGRPIGLDDVIYGAMSWELGNKTNPVQLVSPDVYARDGIPYRFGYGQINCAVSIGLDHNLECKFTSPQFSHAFNGQYKFGTTVTGVLTNECLRLNSTWVQNVEEVSMNGSADAVVETQTSALVRYRLWR